MDKGESSGKKIGIIGGGLAPHFNEAMANQMHLLSKKLNAQVITCNDLGGLPFKKVDQYFIVNTKFIMNKTPFLSFINGAILYTVMKLSERKFDVLIIPNGIDSEFLNYLDLKKCVPIVSCIPFINESVENKIKKLALELRGIIVQSERTKRQLIDMGVDPDRIVLMYPMIDLSKFKYCEPPPLNKFKILFASSPNLEVAGEDNFRDKGVHLLLEAFKEFIKEEDAMLYIGWRGKYNNSLYQKINALNLGDYVKVIDKIVAMPEMYAKTHVTVIPFVNLWRSPEIPMSAVESLACGRPVVATDVGEIADIVRKYKCGYVAKPLKNEFLVALKECKRKYFVHQKNCRKVAEELFSLDIGRVKEICVGGDRMNGLRELKPNICVITYPFNNLAAETILENFIKILEPLSNKIFVITGNISEMANKKIHIKKLKGINEKNSILKSIPKFILTQIRISLNILKNYKSMNIVIFYIGARLYIVPIIVAKLLRKEVVVVAAGSNSKIFEVIFGKKWFGVGIIFSRLVGVLEKITLSLSDRIFVESESAIPFLELEKYADKISIGGTPYVDISLFKIEKDLDKRRNLVGYIGRLVEQKGVINFVKAVPMLLKERNDVEFLVGGEGPLFNEIISELKRSESLSKVEVTGLIPSNEFVGYLNELKLLALPSYEEGLPGIVKQAMACGTPVLATPVGGIPDLIKDGETGFTMENNSPECIAENIIRALNHPNLDEIVKNARKLIEEEYTYEILVEKCKKSLWVLSGKDKYSKHFKKLNG